MSTPLEVDLRESCNILRSSSHTSVLARLVHLLPLALLLLGQSTGAQALPRPPWANAIDSLMRAELARTGTPGAQIAIVEHGRVAYTSGYGLADVETGRSVNERTLFQTGSITKLVTATLVAQLAAEGRIDLHAPISRYVPELTGRRVGTATMHQLLTHSAGWRDSGNPHGRTDDAALGDELRVLGDTMVMAEPGIIYSYSNPSFSMAGYVAERVTRQPYPDLLDSLVRRMGMTRATGRPMVAMTRDFSLGYAGLPRAPAVVSPMPANSAELPSGFLYATTAEMARLAITLMDGGMLDGSRVLSTQAVQSITTGYIPAPGIRFGHVGYGLNVDSIDGHWRWQKPGRLPGFHTLITMWPTEKLAVVVFANRDNDLPEQATALAAHIVAGMPPPVALPVTERPPTTAERAALVGTYRLGSNTMEILEEHDRLEMRRPRFSAPIRMTDTDRFVVTSPNGETLDFFVIRDAAGTVRYLHSRGRAYPRLP